MYLAAFATGAAGLIFQVAWHKYLARLLGSDAVATAVILAAFLGGLAAGYGLCGRWSATATRPFKGYAILEGIIGAWALCFPRLFDLVRDATAGWSFAPPVGLILQGFVCAVVLIGIPTLCMGGTVPFLTQGLSRSLAQSTAVHARVYAVNTGGAFAGALAAAYALIPHLGLPLTVMATGLVNLAAGLFFVFLPAVSKPAETLPAPSPDRPAGPGGISPALGAVAFLSGFYVMSLENVLIRAAGLSMGSASTTFALVVAVFVLAIALGSAAVARIAAWRPWSGPGLLAGNQALILAGILTVYATLDAWPYAAHLIRITFQSNAAGFWGYQGAVLAVLTLVLIVPVGAMGATVPILFHMARRDLGHVGRVSGRLLACNAAGNLAGSLVGGVVLFYWLNLAGVFLVAAAAAALALALALRQGARPLRWAVLGAGAVLVVAAANPPLYRPEAMNLGIYQSRLSLAFSLDGAATFYRRYQGVNTFCFIKDDPCASVAVVETPEPALGLAASRALLVNGKSDSSTAGDAATLRLLAHLPALMAARRDRVFVVGLGTGVTAGELARYPDVTGIDVAEIAPAVVEALPLFGDYTGNVHEDPRLKVHIGDAFRVLGRSNKHWDLIVSEPSNLWVTGVDLLFTEEFYRLARSRLHEQGLFVQWMHGYNADSAMVGMVVNTVRQVFDHCRVFLSQANDLIILAAATPLDEKMAARAGANLERFAGVRQSLAAVGFADLADILAREIWPQRLTRTGFGGYGVQTLDFPRLHYRAGRCFFNGDAVASGWLFGPWSVAYADDYLLNRALADRPPATWQRIGAALGRSGAPVFAAMGEALRLRAQAASAPLPLDPCHPQHQLLGLITGQRREEAAWAAAGLAEAGPRRRAEALLDHVRTSRTWLSAYRLDGLKDLLATWQATAPNRQQANWFGLQRAWLAFAQEGDAATARSVLDQLRQQGQIAVDPQDRDLVRHIEALSELRITF